MTSRALTDWRSTRALRLDNLANAHRAVAGVGPGRKWLTTEINHALIVRLATEFQGFCRDLHDSSIETIVTTRLGGDPAMASLMRSLLEDKRRLDTGNAGWGNVCHDFTRLGIRLADELAARNPGSYGEWVETLERLNKARNAIAHDDRSRLAECQAQRPLTISTFRAWRRTLSAIAAGLDETVGAYLKELANSPASRGGIP
ncbi:MAG: hypothetical protein ACT4P1_03125 [Sporichthyaceae bacterium]